MKRVLALLVLATLAWWFWPRDRGLPEIDYDEAWGV